MNVNKIASNNHYNNKKLAPFRKQKETLTEELQKLQKEYTEEEKLNDIYFDELGKVEKDYDILLKELEHLSKNQQLKTIGSTDQNQGLDSIIDKQVIQTLDIFLLNKSKKEELELIQDKEYRKKNYDQKNIQMNELNLKKQSQYEDETNNIDDGYYLMLQQDKKRLFIKIPGTIRTFKELKSIVKSCFMAEEQEIFYKDKMGNILQDDMNVLEELYPPIYDLLKNYQPLVDIEIVKQKKQLQNKQNIIQNEIEENSSIQQFDFQRTIIKKPIKQVDWAKYLEYLTNFKYFLESILFIVLLIIFAIVEVDPSNFVTNSQLLQAFSTKLPISQAMISPIDNLTSIIALTIPNITANETYSTFPLKSALLVQTLAGVDPLDTCFIYNEKQKQMFIDKNESCLNFDKTQTSDLDEEYTYTNINPRKYDNIQGGYVWELNLTSRESFLNNYELMVNESWVKFNKKQSKFILNYFNSPTKRMVQASISTIYLFNDKLLNYNSIHFETFDLSNTTETVVLFNEITFYIALFLLVSAFFDFFGFYVQGTKNNIVVIYLSYTELIKKKQKLATKKRELTPQETRELKQKQLIIGEYFVINLKVVYIVIKIPLIFDIIYILCNLGIVIRNTIKLQYENALNDIHPQEDTYQDAENLIIPLYLNRIYSGILILFLMISIVRFLGNLSPYLKCYGLVMIRFNRESSFLLLVLVYIISVSAMAWSITLQGKLLWHDNFFFTFIGLLRCTLKYGMHNDIEEQNLYGNYAKAISYSFETRYIQYIIVIVISLIMVPIFISLMTQQVHNTKIEAKQKMLELKNQFEKKTTTK